MVGLGNRTFWKFVVAIGFVLLLELSEVSSAASVVSESETKTIEPTNNPTKVFIRRRIFRKLVKDGGNNSTEAADSSSSSTTSGSTETTSSTTSRPRTLYSLVKRLDTTGSVSAKTIKSSIQSQSLLPKHKFNFQSLKTRLGLAAESTTTTPETPSSTTTISQNSSSMVMIPLPPNQRKPYTPVIMQVSKATTASPSTTVHTYKLNKMFVPIGIYGKVLENSTAEGEQKPMSSGDSHESGGVVSNSTPIPSIRHKGTDSGEKKSSRKHKGIAESVDLTYSYKPKVDSISLTSERPDIGKISITTEANELFDSVFGTNNVRRGDSYSKYSGNSGMSLMTPPALGTPSPGNYPTRNKVTASSMLDSITDSVSRIPSLVPSLFHKGLTSLASMTSSMRENPFVDDNFSETISKRPNKPLVSAPSSYSPKIPASVPGGYIAGHNSGSSSSNKRRKNPDQYASGSEVSGSQHQQSQADIEYETLEYFRKRPHLLAQLQRQNAYRRSMGIRFSKGFKPAVAPEYLAREYYKSTSTTASTPQQQEGGRRKGKKGGWLLRNSDEYVANRNDQVVRVWRSLFDTFSAPEPSPDPQSTLTNRRSVLNAHWSDITKKYSKDQIDEAKDRILTLLNSGYGDEALEHELADEEELQLHGYGHEAHMPPPPAGHALKALSLTKGLSSAAAGAFKDLVKFFKLGISVGGGRAHEPVNYEQVVDDQEEQEIAAGGGGDWKPVARRPLISFSAGISLKTPGSGRHHDDHHHHHDHHHHSHSSDTSHYSSSSKPYIPATYKPLNSYMDELAVSHSSKPTSPYSEVAAYGEEHPHQAIDYDNVQDDVVASLDSDGPADPLDDDVAGYASDSQKTYATAEGDSLNSHYSQQQQQQSHRPSSSSYSSSASKDTLRHSYSSNRNPHAYDSSPQYSYKHYSTLKPSREPRPMHHADNDMHPSDSNWKPVGMGSNSEYELIPSDVYLNTPHDPRDIAAVVKPEGIDEDMLRSHLPAGLRNLPTLNYPNEYAYSSNLNTISQYLGQKKPQNPAASASFKHAMKKLRENYEVKEAAYLPVVDSPIGVYEQEGGSSNKYRGSFASGLGSYTGLGASSLSGLSAAGLSGLSAAGLSGLSASTLSGLSGGGYAGSSGLGIGALGHSQSALRYVGAQGLVGQFPSRGSVLATANQINNQGRGAAAAYAQKDSLGFTSNYNLPQTLDPDIAAILKSELDKDDIPEDVRQEFLEAKREEEAKNKAKMQSASRRVDVAQQALIKSILSSTNPTAPTTHNNNNAYHTSILQQTPTDSRSFRPNQPSFARQLPYGAPPPMVTTRFFAPIPITPTLMTTAMRNPRYQSPVPRYVIELAKKLQTDKSVQGIVRVSAKRGRGLPPIEYLYPVKG